MKVFTFFILFLLSVPLQAEVPKKVLWVPMKGTVELGLSPYIQRALQYAEEKKFEALILEVDTFGGRVDAAVNIRDALLDSKIQTVTWVNKRAISAGALISLACKKIFFAPGSTMGAATPIQMGAQGAEPVENKIVSYFRAEMGATAEKNGRPRKIAESMVKATETIKGLVNKNDVLTLTDKSALETKISDGTIATQEELLKYLGYAISDIEPFEINWAEKIVRFLTDPTVSSLLISGGVLGVIFELQAPGFGFPGILGFTCLTLFFFGKYLVHLAGWEEILLFALGLLFLAAEILLFPGHILPGVLGLIIIFIALLLAGLSPKIPFDFDFPPLQEHVRSLAISFVVIFVGFIFIYWWYLKNLKKAPLVLSEEFQSQKGYGSTTDSQELLHQEGVALTDLRPSGKARIKNQVVEVVTEGSFIEKDRPVEVILVDGMRVVVKEMRS